ncbi:unnamed protein product [Porites lobata]|uniref:Uncharacterized protein n=1 Tax=Porites lobata TaxID=104759 RepID=A0ABN8QQD1_9CNID|nr:unnamed protein product [Porites lobata]
MLARLVKMPKTSSKSTRTKAKNKRKATADPAETASEIPVVDIKETMMSEMRDVGYDGTHFAMSLEASVENKMKRGKPPRRNRYLHYCNWAHALLRREIGPPDAEFAFPPCVLTYIRHLAPGDVKGEIKEDAYQVTMKEFCEAMDLQPTN